MQTPPRAARARAQPATPVRHRAVTPPRMNPGGSPGTPRGRTRHSPRRSPHRNGLRQSGVHAGSPNRGGSRRRRK